MGGFISKEQGKSYKDRLVVYNVSCLAEPSHHPSEEEWLIVGPGQICEVFVLQQEEDTPTGTGTQLLSLYCS